MLEQSLLIHLNIAVTDLNKVITKLGYKILDHNLNMVEKFIKTKEISLQSQFQDLILRLRLLVLGYITIDQGRHRRFRIVEMLLPLPIMGVATAVIRQDISLL